MSSDFGKTSTVEEVLQGRSLRNTRVLITGVSAGVGLEMARALSHHGAEVIGAARNLEKAQTAYGSMGGDAVPAGRIRLEQLDLASLISVRACASRLQERGDCFDVVFANAGVMAVPEGRTIDGFETHFATNYLGHFALVNLITNLFKPDGRLVMISSAGHRGADVDLDDFSFERTPYNPLLAYRRSKTATILFSAEFDRRNHARGIRGTAVHPGAVLTETTRELIRGQPAAASAFTWKTVAQGAATPVWAGLVAPAAEVGGRYCEDCHVSQVMDDPSASYGARSYALDQNRAQILWLKSEALVTETF